MIDDFPRFLVNAEEVMFPLIEAAAPILRAQHSLITRRQAISLGNSDATVRHLLDTGVWEIVDRALYGPTGVPMTWRRQLMAALLLARPGSLISHRASAALRGVGGLIEPTPEITIPRASRLRRPWLIVHRSLDLHLADTVEIDGIQTTGPLRLAMDLGGTVSYARFKHTVRELRHHHGVESRDLMRTYLQHKRQGRTGGGALRDWLDRYYGIIGISESGAELVVLDALLDAGLPAPVRQFWVEVAGSRYRLDIAYPEWKICIEVDGVQHDDDPDVVVHDSVRNRDLVAVGWEILRVRARHLASDLPAVLRNLGTVLVSPPQEGFQDSPGGGSG